MTTTFRITTVFPIVSNVLFYVGGYAIDTESNGNSAGLPELQKVFSIEIAAYAVISSHYHLVVRLNDEGFVDWDDQEVIHR
ncbi:hypothetical protein [Pleionea sp. CnH1-48]|uniref:hypothetical protein n=1 Tax=Pleionea sp. CnH1-48 TaxID=2954494 RepID=UPI0020970CBB|nr:hypothetical protein [Pleionea sp. CnH1-48]MCO7227472.1 hypothetical protein [Pleionea sp. CnH1-48]